jgi:hypothetical protein
VCGARGRLPHRPKEEGWDKMPSCCNASVLSPSTLVVALLCTAALSNNWSSAAAAEPVIVGGAASISSSLSSPPSPPPTTTTTAASSATTYFVSPWGSDAAPGITTDKPLLTLSAASRKLIAGDTLLLLRGGAWLDQTLTSVAAGLTIGAYGDPGAPLPLIQHGRTLNTGPERACAAFMEANGLSVSDLHLSGCSGGLRIGGLTAGNATDVLVQRVFFADIRTPFLVYSPPSPAWAVALSLTGGQFRNLTVRNCFAVRIDVFFSSKAHVTGMHLDSNTVQQCSGNCYSLGSGVDLLMQDSVFLRDMSTRLFMYGTTDIIVGGLRGSNAVVNTDFNGRGEYQGGPDGCAFDFETGATGFEISGNYFSRSWGAGIMIFGHSQTSHGIKLTDNVFESTGCVQNRNDKGGIAVMCPGGHKPDGLIANNSFFTCPNVSAIFVNPGVPGCADNMVLRNNSIVAAASPRARLVAMPQVSFNPPAPTSNASSGIYNVIGACKTQGAIIRYTLDGSRPSDKSPILPLPMGINLPWPGPALIVNMRAFKVGWLPSVTNGAVMELNYGLGRMAAATERTPWRLGELRGRLDFHGLDNSNITLRGWVVDPLLPKNGSMPVTVVISVDGRPVLSQLANEPRPDLVTAGVAPDPEHGFVACLPKSATTALMGPGKHVLDVHAIGGPNCPSPARLPEFSEVMVCDGKLCEDAR